MVARGDDLEDDYAPDDLVALSDDDEIDNSMEFAPLEGEEDQFVADDDADPPVRGIPKNPVQLLPTQSDDAKQEKKRKKRAKDNERKAKVRVFLLELPHCFKWRLAHGTPQFLRNNA